MKKTQYLIIDSDFVDGTNNSFSVTFGLESNTFIQEMKDVIAIKLLDVYITQIGDTGTGKGNAAKYVDIVCPDIPLAGQILCERAGQIFARVPLERDADGGSNYVVHDKEWKSYTHETRYFNPISIKTLNFKMFEYQGDGDYVPLQPDAEFYMVLEITTMDYTKPPEDKLVTVNENLEKISKKLDRITKIMLRPPEPPKKKMPLMYLGLGIVGILLILYLFKTFQKSSAPAVQTQAQVPGAPQQRLPLLVPGPGPQVPRALPQVPPGYL